MQCQCERCNRVVEKRGRSWFRVAVLIASYSVTLPFAWTLFVAGPGVLGTIPIVMFLGFSVEMMLRDWVSPRELCPHCGATLEWAPVIGARLPYAASREVS